MLDLVVTQLAAGQSPALDSWTRGSRRRGSARAGAGPLEPARVRSSGRGSRRRWEPSSALLDLVVKLKPPGQQLDAG